MTSDVQNGNYVVYMVHIISYKGQTMTRQEFLKSSVATTVLSMLPTASAADNGTKAEIRCEGEYPLHLQGVATDGKSIFWTFTSVLVKTDLKGRFVSRYEINRADGHMGDLCCHDGRVYVSMAMGDKGGCRVGDEVWEFDIASLLLLKRHPTPQTVWSNNGIEFYSDSFWVTSSAPKHCRYNMVFRYTPDFKFMRCQMIDSGWTNRGVQTIFLRNGEIFLGCYGSLDDKMFPHKSCTLVVDGNALADTEGPSKAPQLVPCERRVEIGTAEGMLELDGVLMAGRSMRLLPQDKKIQSWSARLVPVEI